MPRPSLIGSLTAAERNTVNKAVMARNFADYDGLVAMLAAADLEINRTTLARHGLKLKKRLQMVKDATDAAEMLVSNSPDDTNARSEAVISMVQSEMFGVMVSLQDLDGASPEERVALLKDMSKSMLDMTRASQMQKKWRLDIVRQTRMEAANEVVAGLKAEGISADVEASIRRILIGK